MTIQISLQCEDAEEARKYLNAVAYHSLIWDFAERMRQAEKHDGELLAVLNMFKQDFYNATEHHCGPY